MADFPMYPFYDLIAEESYAYSNPVLRNGSREQFWKREASKNVYMFGCNAACRLFIELYGAELEIRGVLDNAKAKVGMDFAGKTVISVSETIPKLSPDKDVVIIAMRLNGDKIAEQLDGFGFPNYYGLAKLIADTPPFSELVEYAEQLKKQETEDIVMLESTNDFDGNAGALYEWLKQGHSAHRFVWVLKNKANEKLCMDEKDTAVCPAYSEEDMRRYILYRAKASWQIWDNNPIRKVRQDQVNVFLQHFGMGYKLMKHTYNAPEYVDYVLTTTESAYTYVSKSLLYAPSSKILFGELPRNDVLVRGTWDELSKITRRKFKKVVMWAPTLRDLSMFEWVDSDIAYPFGIPLLYTDGEMEAVNAFLRERNMLLIIKIHPRQKRNYRTDCYSNILYLDAEFEKRNGRVHAYKLMTQTDAMISDYSSIVFDYMLLNRPIAWVLEDREHFQIPFLMENPLDYMPGDRIYTVSQLFSFLHEVYQGRDAYRDARNEIAERYNAPKEGRGCENLVKLLNL